jgi:hypothetical protein
LGKNVSHLDVSVWEKRCAARRFFAIRRSTGWGQSLGAAIIPDNLAHMYELKFWEKRCAVGSFFAIRRSTGRGQSLGAAIGLHNLALLVHGDRLGDPRPPWL